jgi:hypothetical protein
MPSWSYEKLLLNSIRGAEARYAEYEAFPKITAIVPVDIEWMVTRR